MHFTKYRFDVRMYKQLKSFLLQCSFLLIIILVRKTCRDKPLKHVDYCLLDSKPSLTALSYECTLDKIRKKGKFGIFRTCEKSSGKCNYYL